MLFLLLQSTKAVLMILTAYLCYRLIKISGAFSIDMGQYFATVVIILIHFLYIIYCVLIQLYFCLYLYCFMHSLLPQINFFSLIFDISANRHSKAINQCLYIDDALANYCQMSKHCLRNWHHQLTSTSESSKFTSERIYYSHKLAGGFYTCLPLPFFYSFPFIFHFLI